MRAVFALALLGTVLSAVAINDDTHVEALDDLHLVEVVEGSSCTQEITQAKTRCQEELAEEKEKEASNCGMKTLNSLMARIKSNNQKLRGLANKLGSDESKLRHLQYEEGSIKGSAAQAKEKVLKAMVHQYHQKQALMGDEKKVKAELADENSTRSKANRKTHEAEKLARKEPKMSKVTTASNAAKALWAKMVDEKVNSGRAYYKMNKDKKMKKVTDKEIDRLFRLAQAARRKEESELKKVKDATTKVAKNNAKVTKKEAQIAKEEKEASEKEKAEFKKKESKLESKYKKGMTDVQKREVDVKHYTEERDRAAKEVQNLSGMGLKGMLNEAPKLLKKMPKKP